MTMTELKEIESEILKKMENEAIFDKMSPFLKQQILRFCIEIAVEERERICIPKETKQN
jgi:hypothetical protein